MNQLKKDSQNWLKFTISTLIILGLIFLFFKFLTTSNGNYKKEIMDNPVIVVGRIESVRSYKKKAFDIIYNFGGQQFDIHPSVTMPIFNRYKEGDTISLYVSKKNPNMAILKSQ
jgi:hypothetical protein